MEQKKWYYSKTLWANFVAVVAIAVQGLAGKELINPEVQGAVLGMVNLGLRFITKSDVVW